LLKPIRMGIFSTNASITIRLSDSSGLPERGSKVFPSEAYAALAPGRIFERISLLDGGDWLIKFANGRFARIGPSRRDFELIEE
jgi:hypothetical protein